MSFLKRIYLLLPGILLFCGEGTNAQSKSESYLFHFLPFKDEHPAEAPHGRTVKVLLDFGLCTQFYVNDPHYTNGTMGNGSYTFGCKLQIPIFHSDDIITGIDFVRGSFSFNSYYFAKGYSVLYDSNQIYNHAVDMDEMQIPIEYKLNFASETRNTKNIYMTFGWIMRYVFYDNTYIENAKSGDFVFEGQECIHSLFPFITNHCSGMMEASIGYQHNGMASGNGWYFEVKYKYGFSPLIYTGNNQGSNYVQFTLNTLSYELGFRF